MNPDRSIRPWLLAAGKQFGIREAHDYVWPDADTRQDEMYFTYQVVSMRELEEGKRNLNSKTVNTAEWHIIKAMKTFVQIDLYRSQNGMEELAAIVAAEQGIPSIKRLLPGCALKSIVSIENESKITDEETYYHMRMICEFEENIEYELNENNGTVDDVEYTLTVNGAE